MTGLEETFRQVLAARLPDDPKWAAWIDGTVQELAAAVPAQGMDRGALITLIVRDSEYESWTAEAFADRILALEQSGAVS